MERLIADFQIQYKTHPVLAQVWLDYLAFPHRPAQVQAVIQKGRLALKQCQTIGDLRLSEIMLLALF